MREALKYGFILGIICFFASGVLAVVNGVTEPKIKLQKQIEEESALKEVLPEAEEFRPNTEGENIDFYRAYDKNNKLIGFVVKSVGKGYSSDIEVLTGLDLNLEITNIKILSQNETPGLGSRVTEPSFNGQFNGKNLESLGQVEAITGATISSGAVISSIKDRIAVFSDALQKEIRDAR